MGGPGLPAKRRPPPKPRQEISRCLKYILFCLNFIFLLIGMGAFGLGAYLACLEWRPVKAVSDMLLNPAIVLLCLGTVTIFVTLTGCMGSLRENVCLLKTFALTLFMSYIALVLGAFVLFVLFYSDSNAGISINTFLLGAVDAYHDNANYRDLLDYLQTQLECCGATSQGYRDWSRSPQFNCSTTNSLPEKCGVPYSCCLPSQPQALALDPSLKPPVQCWRGAQRLSLTELKGRIHTDGCLEPLQSAFEGHAVVVGAAIGAIIIPVCLSVMFANILGKQIERQRYLLDKEARKEERRRRKTRLRLKDSFSRAYQSLRRKRVGPSRQHQYAMVDETTDSTYVTPPTELRPESLAMPSPPPRKESTLESRRPTETLDRKVSDYAGLKIEEVATERLPKYQRPKRSREEIARRLEGGKSKDDLEPIVSPRRRTRHKSEAQYGPHGVGAKPSGKERKKRKKSAPSLHYSSSSTLHPNGASSSSLPDSRRASPVYASQKRSLQF